MEITLGHTYRWHATIIKNYENMLQNVSLNFFSGKHAPELL